jgi:hypothetical protein
LTARPGVLLALLAALLAWWVLGEPDAGDEADTVEAVARPAARAPGPASAAAPITPAGPARPAPGAGASDTLASAPAGANARPDRPDAPPPGTPLRTTLRASADLFPVPPAPRPPPPPPPGPPPPPVAPKPQFALIGRLVDGSVPTAVLRDGERVVTLRAGQQEAGFRLVGVDENGVSLVHEATGLPVRIGFGEPGPGAGVPRLARASGAVAPNVEGSKDD